MRKQMKYIAVFAIPHACIILFCLLMIFLNLATPFISGFGVDALGRIYVGENETICIYQDGIKVGCIYLKGSNYTFTLDEDDNILVAYPSRAYLMDMSGNVLETKEDPTAQIYSQIQSNGGTTVSANGDRYRKAGEFGWTRIVKNNSEVVYRISIFSFVIKCLMPLCAASMYINGVWVIYRVHKSRESDN